MTYTEQDIAKAIANLEEKKLAHIVRYYHGHIVLAQSESDFNIKASKIRRGDTIGFFTVEDALSLKKI